MTTKIYYRLRREIKERKEIRIKGKTMPVGISSLQNQCIIEFLISDIILN